MHVIHATNVNDALAQGLQYIVEHGAPEPSRNGSVLVAPGPVTTVYSKPWQRVLFSPVRDANPFFHLMEALWMVAGRNDIAWPKFFNSRMGAYSDDGSIQRGAYGHRWRQWFGYDQLRVIAEELKANPASRRCVLAMWDAGEFSNQSWFERDTDLLGRTDKEPGDLLADTVDKPCNTHIYFRVVKGRLDMTVCCRSNDILWGAYGANSVHMSVLQEVMAAWVGIEVGLYYQMSNNYHLYDNVLTAYDAVRMAKDVQDYDQYRQGVAAFPIVNTPMTNLPGGWLYDLNTFMEWPSGRSSSPAHPLYDPFFKLVAQPMYMAWLTRKNKEGDGSEHAKKIISPDWRYACLAWIHRREEAKLAK